MTLISFRKLTSCSNVCANKPYSDLVLKNQKKVARSCCFSSPLTQSRFGLTRAAPVNFPVKLLFLVPSTIAARFYPSCIFESSAKPLASALIPGRPGFTRAAANLAAKPFPLSDAPETRSV
jgi:hypothetical protein